MKNTAFIIVFSCIFFSCTEQKNILKCHEFEAVRMDSIMTLTDLYEDFQFIPLENDSIGMLSYAMKLEAVPEGFIIHDLGAKSRALMFDDKGLLVGQIGDVGRSSNEYMGAVDLSVNQNTKEVAILTMNHEVKTYDYQGTCKSTMNLSRDVIFNNLCWNGDNFVCATRHNTYGDSLLYVYDMHGNLVNKALSPLPVDIVEASFVANPLQAYANKVLFIDFFRSSFTIMDMEDTDKYESLKIKSDNMFTYDKKILENHMNTRDFLNSGFCNDSTIYGWMNYDSSLSYYTMNLYDGEAHIYPYYGSPAKACGLSIDSRKSKQEEFSVYDASELRSKLFDFCIERFRRSIGRTVDEIV